MVRWLEWGANSFFQILLGSTLVLSGVAISRTALAGRWQGWVAVAAGVCLIAGGVMWIALTCVLDVQVAAGFGVQRSTRTPTTSVSRSVVRSAGERGGSTAAAPDRVPTWPTGPAARLVALRGPSFGARAQLIADMYTWQSAWSGA
jgi:hypothetical protein